MQALHAARKYLLPSALTVTLCAAALAARANSGDAKAGPRETAKERDGQHDFDWDIGTWRVHMRRLLHPLTGSTTSPEYNATDAVPTPSAARATLPQPPPAPPPPHP